MPQALEQDGTILALTNRGRAQVDLVRIDPSRPGDFETVHSVPGIDLTGVVRSEGNGDVVGVRYYAAGEARVHLFDALIRGWHGKLQAAFPGQAVEFADVNLARGRSIVMVSNDVTPPVYYLFNVSTSKAEKLRDSHFAQLGDHWTHETPWVRCITRGVPGGFFPAQYNNGYTIHQAPGVVVIVYEMIHDARIIPLDDKPHVGQGVRLWNGDARGRWEGTTLVVETTNFNGKSMLATSAASGRLRGVTQSRRISPLVGSVASSR